ncbi:MAG: GNAT family N-acetyltransferase [Chthoniobacterales bacterium]
MTEADLDAVAALAVIGFPDHFEGRPCFANRLALYPAGCFVLAENPVIPSTVEGSRRASEKHESQEGSKRKPDGIPRLRFAPLGMTAGYLIAYPSLADDPPSLNILLDALPADPAVMYLHDLALHPDARGAGRAAEIIEHLVEITRAAGLPAIALVAVNHAAAFWERHEFEVRETPALRRKLASYGPDARYMVRALSRAVIG